MRAIIIEEERFAEVCELMRKRTTDITNNAYLLERCGLTKEQAQFAVDELHRAMHYEFVRWAQSHGASCVRS